MNHEYLILASASALMILEREDHPVSKKEMAAIQEICKAVILLAKEKGVTTEDIVNKIMERVLRTMQA